MNIIKVAILRGNPNRERDIGAFGLAGLAAGTVGGALLGGGIEAYRQRAKDKDKKSLIRAKFAKGLLEGAAVGSLAGGLGGAGVGYLYNKKTMGTK